jgi:hypothetical protein
MNKWMKNGMTVAVGASAFAAAIAVAKVNPKVPPSSNAQTISVDALDFAGGSKLKDRRVIATEGSELRIVIA